jgi:exodeoxyribonuclease VII small subunit
MAARKKSFEKAMAELETIVQELESGNMPLEKAISKYEEGMQLSKFCTQKLDEAEKKITLLMKTNNGGVVEKLVENEDNNII